MLIKVTQEDIDAGKRGNCFKCPVALAVKRVVNNGFVEAGIDSIRVNELDWYQTPTYVCSFMFLFDKFGSDSTFAKPFEFELTERF